MEDGVRILVGLPDQMVKGQRLVGTEVVNIEEMVAIFLHILAHDVKNRVGRRQFVRSGETVSRHFNSILNVVLRLHEDCLGALNDMYIKVNMNAIDQPRWEGSAAASRVLRDVISRPNKLKILKGYCYLCDGGYPNAKGFLVPYRGERYNLSECRGGGNAPTTAREFFNMKHSYMRNVIERAFGLLKGRRAILCRKSYYPMQDETQIITTCYLLHNLINKEMNTGEMAEDLDEMDSHSSTISGDEFNYIESSNE
ncbi:uncharacterized protein LOC120084975 [Benincasa hispida]|uniref:uncharacterized protein LOC120084975 n=1 Tax=Benincasa hispida TaxID=102211 RepID=UPI00190164EB|nr:uncharacterized protein LOC120084975 [Benincasa hispida]